MGWETINYACGHGSTKKQMYGKHSERKRKVSWMEFNMVCPECYKKSQQEKRKSETLTAELTTSLYGHIGGGWAMVIVRGDSYSIKDGLKACGCIWGDYTNADDLLGMRQQIKKWMLIIAKKGEELTTDKIANAITKLKTAGIIDFVVDNSPLAIVNRQIISTVIHNSDS